MLLNADGLLPRPYPAPPNPPRCTERLKKKTELTLVPLSFQQLFKKMTACAYKKEAKLE